MSGFWKSAIGFFCLGIVAGCAPQLAKVPYTELEQQWIDYLDEAYPCWTPPQTIPPVATEATTEKKVEKKASVESDGIPAEANIPALPQAQPEIEPATSLKPDSSVNEKLTTMEENMVNPTTTSPTETSAEPETTKQDNEEEITQPPPFKEKYTVRKGDTLWRIAQKFYKNGRKWKVIYEANKDIIKNPNIVPAGIEIVIPPLD